MTTDDHPSPETNETLLEATFDRATLIKYHWVGLVPACIFIVTIPIVVVVAIFYAFMLDRVIASWSATLTQRSLIVRKGVFSKVERTIPLEKITDLSSTQGPIMRMFDLKRLGVETAGQSTGTEGGSLVSLIGIEDTDGFRRRVLAQRDAITMRGGASPSPMVGTSDSEGESELAEIAATLRRMESTLERIAGGRNTARDD